MSPYLPPSDPLLIQEVPAVPVEEILSVETQLAIDTMYAVAESECTEPGKCGMVGLAAPQIGIAKSIILVDVGVDHSRSSFGPMHVFINPEILWYSDDQEEGREGCFSVDARVWGIVRRASRIKVAAFDREGNALVKEFSGVTARIFQHEIDHLRGKRFPDRVGEQGVLHWVEEEQYSVYREKWQSWPVRCPWNIWLSMKEGRDYAISDESPSQSGSAVADR